MAPQSVALPMKFSRRGLARARLRRTAEPWCKVRPQLTIRDWYFLGFAVSTIREKRNLQGRSPSRYLALADPIVQWPRTPPFHGGNTGSNPVRVATIISWAEPKEHKPFAAEIRERWNATGPKWKSTSSTLGVGPRAARSLLIVFDQLGRSFV